VLAATRARFLDVPVVLLTPLQQVDEVELGVYPFALVATSGRRILRQILCSDKINEEGRALGI